MYNLIQTQQQTQAFFFVSSVGFILLWVLTAVFLFYLIRATSSLSRIIEKAEKDIDRLGDTTKELLAEVKDSAIFSFLFKKKKKSRKEK